MTSCLCVCFQFMLFGGTLLWRRGSTPKAYSQKHRTTFIHVCVLGDIHLYPPILTTSQTVAWSVSVCEAVAVCACYLFTVCICSPLSLGQDSSGHSSINVQLLLQAAFHVSSFSLHTLRTVHTRCIFERARTNM